MAIFGVLWFVETSPCLSLCVHGVFSPSVRTCVKVKGTKLQWTGAHLIQCDLTLTNYILKDSFPSKITF